MCRGRDCVTMVEKHACLSRMRLCHDGQEALVSVEDETLSRYLRRSRVCRGRDFVIKAQKLPCLSRRKEEEKLLAKKNKTTTMQFSMAPFCQGWDFVKLSKKLSCLSRKGLCHNDQEALVSVEEGTVLRWSRSTSVCRG